MIRRLSLRVLFLLADCADDMARLFERLSAACDRRIDRLREGREG